MASLKDGHNAGLPDVWATVHLPSLPRLVSCCNVLGWEQEEAEVDHHGLHAVLFADELREAVCETRDQQLLGKIEGVGIPVSSGGTTCCALAAKLENAP